MSYNLSIIADNATSMVGFTQGVNNVLMDGWLGLLLLIGITSIIFLSLLFSTNDAQKAIVASSFIAMVLSFFLRAMSLMSNRVMVIVILIAAISIAFAWNRS